MWFFFFFFFFMLTGMRGTEMPGRSLPPVDELHGQVSLDLPDQKVAVATARHCLPAAGVEAARGRAAHSRTPGILHRQLCDR